MTLPDLPFTIPLAAAREAVRSLALRTPLLPVSPPGSEGPTVALKLENLQVTGSFKVRGAASRLAVLTPAERRAGVVTCSSGNHGRAVAFVARRLGIPATVFVPRWVDPSKLAAIRAAGAEVRMEGDTYDEAESRALAVGASEGKVFVPPFDDPRVVAGQGTVGEEILEQLPRVGSVVVPLSGGGLAGGVGWAAKRRRPGVRIVAVSARRARVMLESLRAGRPVTMEEEETLAEALSGGIGAENRYTLPLVRAVVDDHVTVMEEEIAAAMAYAYRELRLVVEGGGAVGLAALLADRLPRDLPGPVVVVLSGGNVSLRRLATLLAPTGRGIT